MPTFTFYLHDGPETVPAFEIELLDGDDEALVYGRKLLRERPRYSTVEITHGDRVVAVLDRSAAPRDVAAENRSIGAV
jgi:hypothetical protein